MNLCTIDGNNIVFGNHTVYLDNKTFPEGTKAAQEFVNEMALELVEEPDNPRAHAAALRDMNNDGSWRIKFHKA